jgi:hypothetical protein
MFSSDKVWSLEQGRKNLAGLAGSGENIEFNLADTSVRAGRKKLVASP